MNNLDPLATIEEAKNSIELIQDALNDLSYFSVRNDDIFSSQIQNIEEELKKCRQQLL
jgi:hypothetical protein